ncbi:betaine-aldehyde dehydrogenase [Sphingomonas profundi]|uniref:betaine-aldehyde dehydrogenase n=1 Tax=Alterirhizorhabdus profundi TaxID=2681549 RepID=UPI001E465C35|nr:betaine-aldehyde dehydrogenase [Sphingomonas profundi]
MRTAAMASGDDTRSRQLIEMTIDSLAEMGFTGTTLAQVAGRADVSPGLVAHYFGDKDGLLEAAFRLLAARLGDRMLVYLAQAEDARGRLQAVIDANLAPQEVDHRTSKVWLAYWGQVLHAPRLLRIQQIYQRRMLSNLRHALRALVPADEVAQVAAMVAAMIDGVWLRGALSGWTETDSTQARAMLTRFVDNHIASLPQASPERVRHSGVLTPVNPATGAVIATLPVTTLDELETRIARAKAGQAEWAALAPVERGRVLRRAADLLRADNEALARLETLNTGKPIQETEAVDVISGADCLEYYAGVAATIAGQHLDLGAAAFGYTRREPLGLVAGIGAWNYPLQIACWKAAPALACGNAMLFKPAEQTPLTAAKLEDVFREAGLPDGVFQVVQGYGDLGRALCEHPEIAKVSLTGSVPTGRAVAASAGRNLKAVTLELGGKSPLIVFADADIDNAIAGAMLANFYSTGQVCSNGTRVFVQRPILAAFLDRLVARTAQLRIGDPLDPATQIGPLISRTQMDLVLGHIGRARGEGVRLVAGGRRLTEGALADGYYVEPTIFEATDDRAAIVRDEIFGPVMTVLAFDEEDEVIARANDTDFGLAAGVFTQDITRAHRVIARLDAGTCWINQYNVTPVEMPFGGVKASGIGRENGLAAIEHYTRLKSVYVAMAPIDCPY